MSGSPSQKLVGSDLGKIFQVALWSGASAFAIVLIEKLEGFDWAQVVDNPQVAAFAVTAVNVLAYAIKMYFSDTRK